MKQGEYTVYVTFCSYIYYLWIKLCKHGVDLLVPEQKHTLQGHLHFSWELAPDLSDIAFLKTDMHIFPFIWLRYICMRNITLFIKLK